MNNETPTDLPRSERAGFSADSSLKIVRYFGWITNKTEMT
jgi:hypothetical protein